MPRRTSRSIPNDARLTQATQNDSGDTPCDLPADGGRTFHPKERKDSSGGTITFLLWNAYVPSYGKILEKRRSSLAFSLLSATVLETASDHNTSEQGNCRTFVEADGGGVLSVASI